MQAIENALGLNKKATEEPPQNSDNLIADLKNMPKDKQEELAPVIQHLINAYKK